MKTKNDCERILALLKGGYLDNELDDAAREQVNQHVQECPPCRQIKENLEAISLALRSAPRANPPENLWARIEKELSAIDSSEGRAAASPPHRLVLFFTQRNTFALAAAAALVIAAIGFYLGSGRMNNGETTPSWTALIGNDEMREPNLNFGSNIERYFL